MKKFNKESLRLVKDKENKENYYLPKTLFDRQHYGDVRLETKMAYVAILDTLLKKPSFNKDNEALVKMDNPEVIRTLEVLTNKKVDQAKMQGYYQELIVARLIDVDKKDVYVMEVE